MLVLQSALPQEEPMVRKLSNRSNSGPARRGPVRRRTSLVIVLALFTMGLAGCGDPDDGDGGGGGYVAAQLTGQFPASGGL
jgi:hypothetical protein